MFWVICAYYVKYVEHGVVQVWLCGNVEYIFRSDLPLPLLLLNHQESLMLMWLMLIRVFKDIFNVEYLLQKFTQKYALSHKCHTVRVFKFLVKLLFIEYAKTHCIALHCIGCICLAFPNNVLSYVNSKHFPRKSHSHTGSIYKKNSPLCIFK